jgi:hypothetical protein
MMALENRTIDEKVAAVSNGELVNLLTEQRIFLRRKLGPRIPLNGPQGAVSDLQYRLVLLYGKSLQQLLDALAATGFDTKPMGRVSLNVFKSLAGEQSFARTRQRGADVMPGFLQATVSNRAANETWYRRQTGGLGYNASTQHNKRSWYSVLRTKFGFSPYLGPLPPESEENTFPRDKVLPLASLPVSSDTKRVLRAVRKLPTLVTRFRKKYLPGSHWSFALVRGLPPQIEEEEEVVEEEGSEENRNIGGSGGSEALNALRTGDTGSGDAPSATAIVVQVGDLLLTRPENEDDNDGRALHVYPRCDWATKDVPRARFQPSDGTDGIGGNHPPGTEHR